MTTAIKINVNDGKLRNVMSGGETQVDFDFPIFAASHLRIIETDLLGNITELVRDTDFTVPSGSVNQQAGGVADLDAGVYPSGATAGHVFTALQDVPNARTTDFNQAGDFFADVLNQELDLLTQQMQQINRDLNRAPLAPEDTTVSTFALPAPDDGKAILWDGTAGAMKNGPDASEITSANTSALAAAASATDAQTAQTAAESAQADAESAASDAQAAVGGVRVSSNDTTPDNIENKILVGNGLSLSTQNDGGNETRTIDNDFASQVEAEAGTAQDKTMNPLRVAQAIAALAPEPDLIPIDVQFFKTSGTWTKPAGCTAIEIEVVGGGGGGGGAGGGPGDGSNGGTSSFGAHATANGGDGGANSGGDADGADAGSASGGDINLAGAGAPGGGNALDYGGSGSNQIACSGGPGGKSYKWITSGIGATESVTVGGHGNGGTGTYPGGDGGDGYVRVASYK